MCLKNMPAILRMESNQEIKKIAKEKENLGRCCLLNYIGKVKMTDVSRIYLEKWGNCSTKRY